MSFASHDPGFLSGQGASPDGPATTRDGMAIVIVLVFALALLVLGSAYLRSLSQSQPVNPMLLERLQADFFAQGVAQIALFKFKRYPADFYHAFLFDRAGLGNGPLQDFHGGANTPLQDYRPGGTPIGFPVPIATYSTNFLMTSYRGYNRDALLVNVTVRLNQMTQSYQFTVDASRTRIL
jgi:hypothetical protein